MEKRTPAQLREQSLADLQESFALIDGHLADAGSAQFPYLRRVQSLAEARRGLAALRETMMPMLRELLGASGPSAEV